MPELPEVEVVRQGIDRWTAGALITGVEVLDPRSLRRHAPGVEHLRELLTGNRLGTPQRRGKFLWIPLLSASDDPLGEALVIHLGMSGQVLIQEADAPAQKHLKIVLELRGAEDSPRQLRFVDQRIFGGMHLAELVRADHPSGGVPLSALHIAPDPLEPHVDAEALFRRLRARRTGLKRALLDQQLISGIGNIYADEALWRARLHYARRTETITRAQTTALLDAVVEVMTDALAAGGTSFDALYVNVNGASGYFDRSLRCYGQAGLPCSRCGGPPSGSLIRREPFMGRSSYLCPRCQPPPRMGRW